MKKYPEIYRRTLDEAKNGTDGELALYRASMNENIACARGIDEAIRKNFDGLYLNEDAAKSVIEQFGIDRVVYVLANTIQQKDYDGRFSYANKKWAKAIPVTFGRRNYEFISNAHPAVLDGFCNMVKQEYAEKNRKPSIRQQLADAPKASSKPKQKREKNLDKEVI